MQFQQRLVDRAQLFGAEVLVVDGAQQPGFVIVDECQVVHRLQQVGIVDAGRG